MLTYLMKIIKSNFFQSCSLDSPAMSMVGVLFYNVKRILPAGYVLHIFNHLLSYK